MTWANLCVKRVTVDNTGVMGELLSHAACTFPRIIYGVPAKSIQRDAGVSDVKALEAIYLSSSTSLYWVSVFVILKLSHVLTLTRYMHTKLLLLVRVASGDRYMSSSADH